MKALFADIPQALENAAEIARRCNLELELEKTRLPDFTTPAGMTVDDYLARRASEGLASRLERLFPDPVAREREGKRYSERLAFEIKTIVQMVALTILLYFVPEKLGDKPSIPFVIGDWMLAVAALLTLWSGLVHRNAY